MTNIETYILRWVDFVVGAPGKCERIEGAVGNNISDYFACNIALKFEGVDATVKLDGIGSRLHCRHSSLRQWCRRRR